MPHIKFNWADVLYVTILIRIGYVGFKSGLLSELIRILGLLVAFVVSVNNYTSMGLFLASHSKWSGIEINIVSFLFIFSVIVFIFKMVALLSSLVVRNADISVMGKLAGLMLGICRGILLIGFIYALFINSPFKYLSSSAEDRSFSGRYISNITPLMYEIGINFYPFERIDTPLAELLQRRTLKQEVSGETR